MAIAAGCASARLLTAMTVSRTPVANTVRARMRTARFNGLLLLFATYGWYQMPSSFHVAHARTPRNRSAQMEGGCLLRHPLSRDRDLGLERRDCNPSLPFICRLEGQAQRALLNQRRVRLVSDRPKPVAGVDRAVGQERRSGIRRTILNMVEQVEGLPPELEDHAFAEMQREVLIHR